MKVNELYQSFQGEGVYTGISTTFIRLQGCNLRCAWCDTAFAQDGDRGTEMPVSEIVRLVQQVSPYQRSWICITGGEPLQQESELWQLVRLLRQHGYRTEVETNGSFPPPKWSHYVDSWVADIKCPSSGWCGASGYVEWFAMRFRDQVKFVVMTREDLDFALGLLEQRTCVPQVLVSPVIQCDSMGKAMLGDGWLQEVAEFCVEYRLRFSLQVHKVLYGARRGV